MRIRPSQPGTEFTATDPPTALYLMALESRLMKICFSRVRSALTYWGLLKHGKVIRMSRCCACGSTMAWHSSNTSPTDTDSVDNDTFPDSITARSRISFISLRRCHPACKIWAMLSLWEGVSGVAPDSINCAKPRIAFRGLRNSWLMLERKSDFARLAFSAVDFAVSSSTFFSCSTCSICFRSVTSRAAANTPCSVLARS